MPSVAWEGADGQFDEPCAIAADARALLVLDRGTNGLQIFEADGTHLYTRKDLGIYQHAKGLEWDGRLGVGSPSPTVGTRRLFVGQ